MSYMLYDGCSGLQQEHYFYQTSSKPVPKEKLTWEQFRKDLGQLVRVQRVTTDPQQQQLQQSQEEQESPYCTVCTEPLKEHCLLKRMCRCENFPCEGHMCSCKNFSVCFGCVSKALWQGTSSVMKQKGRYRAKCPLCKAEFCARDIVRLQP